MHLHLARQALVQAPGGAPLALAPRDAALLAWLAIEGPTPRDRLAALLWPDSPPQAARNALRQRLFQLRRLLGADLVAGAATLSLADGVTHDLDPADAVLGQAAHEHSAEFTAWLAQQRTRCRDRARSKLAALADRAEQAGDFTEALVPAQELLLLGPLSEDAHRRVIRLLYLRGDRPAALLAFDRCEQVLKDEVGTAPSAETQALLATISAGQGTALPAVAQQLPAGVLLPPRLIGRDAELAALHQGWQAGQIVAVIGEAGLGKTRLLQAFLEPQAGVVRVAGRPGDAGVPFATLARLLRAVVARAPAPLAPDTALPASTRGEIARVLPEFDTPGARPAGEGQRLAMQRAIRLLLSAQAGLAGLIVDDLHFADEASLDLLCTLIDDPGDDGHAVSPPHATTAPALRWALAYRPAEAGSPVQALHDALLEQARLVPVALAPLDEAGLAALVDSLALPGVDGKVLAPGLARRTGGNPLYVLETLKQAWVERTLQKLAADGALPRPVSVARLIERRLTQLSPAAVALARVASIAGVDFSIGMAEHVLQATAMQFADALNELESAQVMRGNAFAHDLVFDAVRGSVPATIAAHTHARVAAYLEPLGTEPARIARHWVSAGQPVRALPWLAKAADAAGAALRGKEQVAFLEQKSRIEETAGDASAAFESALQAATLQVTIDNEGGLGAAQCERLDRLAISPAQRTRARLQRSHLEMMRGAQADSERHAREALREGLRHGADAALIVECRHQLATSLVMQERAAEALEHFEACERWFETQGSEGERAEFQGNYALVFDNLGRLADAVPHHHIAITLTERTGHHSNHVMCLGNLAANRILGGQLREGEVLLARAALARAQQHDASSLEGFGALLQAICDYQGGRYRQALAALEESLQRMAEFAPGFRDPVLMHQCVVWIHLGQWARLQQTLNLIADNPDPAPSTRLRVLMCRAAIARQRGADDAELLQAALPFAPPDESSDLRQMLLLDLAMTGDATQGLRLLDRVRGLAADLGHDGTVIAAQARSARLAATLGDGAAACRHAEAALAGAARADMVRQYRGELWLHCAAGFQAGGDLGRARDALATGRRWVLATADGQVPAEFRPSFLQHNPVNRELLAQADLLGAVHS